MDSPIVIYDNELTDEALNLMKWKLPQYVVNCLVAAGCDNLQVISMMDVTDNPGNSIEQVEAFVCKEQPEHLSQRKFPPGHRMRIQMFVKGVQNLVQPTLKGKGKIAYGTSTSNVGQKMKLKGCDTDGTT